MAASSFNAVLGAPTAARSISSQAPVRAPTDLDLHLRVVGSLLQEHRVYHGARLQAVKDMVLRIFCDLAPEALDVRRIKEVLCFDDVPLVSDDVLRQAVNALVRKDEKLKVVAKNPRQYMLVGPVPPLSDSVRDLIVDCWKRHFKTCSSSTFEQFQRCIAVLFARYGCAAYDTLTSRPGASVRLDEVVNSINLSASDRVEFGECFGDFILSPDPADATLKVKLASAYALLRMNGAGNWGQDELRAFFSGRSFLVDTNVLFELMSRNVGQVTKMFRHLQDLGARFVVGTETIKEFETALRATAEQVIVLTARGVDLVGLVDAQVVRSDWVRALCADHRSPSRKQVQERVELLLNQVDGMLEDAQVERVHLERSADSAERLTRIERVQELALEARPYEKREEVARHDALLWEAVEDEPRLADTVLTLDRSLGRIRCGNRRMAVMLDDVVAYSLMGGAGEAELVELFGHALSQDLYPHAPFLQINDILAIAGMEATLLAGPPRALRRAAADLASMRTRRVASGETISDDEVGRVLISAISSYDGDRRTAHREREVAEAERARAEREAAQRAQAERGAAEANERLARAEREQEEQRKGAEKRLVALEATLETATTERASLKADLAERDRRRTLDLAEEEVRKQATKKRKDWMMFTAGFIILAGVLFVAGILWAGVLAAGVAFLGALWPAAAEETPSVSLPLLALIVTGMVGAAGVAEKWPQVRTALGISSPVTAPSPSSAPSAPTPTAR